MHQKLSDEEYFASLPKKQVGTAVLFFNEQGELLILKPNYKNTWLVPGGSNDAGESPLECAIRETKEEIGLDIPAMRLIGVYHAPSKGIQPDALKFIFSGGVLNEAQITAIQMQVEEFDSYTFKTPTEAIPILSNSLQKSIPECLEALAKNTVAYIDAK